MRIALRAVCAALMVIFAAWACLDLLACDLGWGFAHIVLALFNAIALSLPDEKGKP